MSASANTQSNTVVFSKEGDRPYVTPYVHKPTFRVGDPVYLLNSDGSREGPYEIASLPSAGKCTLSSGSGQPIRNGDEIGTDWVESA
ncbi:uncharacterized protein K444DRAFT_611505 [Hyaloscypha bicolor E]|uniref:Uncharacterized protein n=1 Tax=Hyaloscypha bicolor E TaxID=1095630 RepID=A0A2J6TDZ4_9HELO|nr:uncharacterized protein K444DRAFT_611505 [Hyaloscypha bicolor E]PMD61251.1 hypothetical protein K444DRAFT_611505 [Hyaloscypha bicolor E]